MKPLKLNNAITLETSKNSWFKSIKNTQMSKYIHHFFCKCGHTFTLYSAVNAPQANDMLCSNCDNDIFIDTNAFKLGEVNVETINLSWGADAYENKYTYIISVYLDIPIYIAKQVKLEHKKVLLLTMQKNGSSKSGNPYDVTLYHYITNKYNFRKYKRNTNFEFLARRTLCTFIMNNKTESISWLNTSDLEDFDTRKKLLCLNYFLKHPHLNKLNLFYWDMVSLQSYTKEYPYEMEMLDFIGNNRREKSVKKALYSTYIDSIKTAYYNPHSDFVFSRTINDVNLLVTLLSINPKTKQSLFTDDNYLEGIEFILFLKNQYTEKQICKVFSNIIQNTQTLQNWKDILRMIKKDNAFLDLERYFLKVKLTIKHLHDEIIRALHIANFSSQENAVYNYEERHVSLQGMYDNLVFKLPFSAEELSLWSKFLHNCMFSYANDIQKGRLLIYGVFKKEILLYALELSGKEIVEAKGVYNQPIPSNDMKIIRKWHDTYLDMYVESQKGSTFISPSPMEYTYSYI